MLAALTASPSVAGAEPPTLLDIEAGEKPAVDAAPVTAAPADPSATTPAAAPAAEPGGQKSLLDELDPGGTASPQRPAWDAPPAPAAPTYPFVEHHGYFRFRPDLISNGHLGQAVKRELFEGQIVTTSAIKPPLSLWPANNENNPFADRVGKARGENSLAAASIRFRYQPTLHLADTIRIAATLDVLDNYVLGGDPDYAGAVKRPDVPLVAFATSTKPGSIAVKEAYGEWKTLLGILRVGRQASQWGLGIFANGGGGDGWDGARPTEYYGGPRLPHEGGGQDADFGSYVDRLAFLTKVGPAYVTLLWDYASAGVLGYDKSRVDGQVRDFTDGDDVNQFGLVLFQRPLTPQEIEARKSRLLDEGRPGFDWGVYSIYRWQDLDVQGTKPANTFDIDTAKDVQLMPRNAWAAASDLWLRYERRLAFSRRLLIEAEFAGLFGKIEDAGTIGGQAPKAKDIQMFGGAIKAAWQNEGFGIMIDTGFASGDDTGCFGVLGDGTCSLDTAAGQANDKIQGFKFHKNYRVGSLLFRDVIG
ncbi:MAG: hypothetical protein EXR79_11235, partial [Myxococcales bacterium]|nr:hypothetical protein [Myxococcales bacterium]